MSKTGVPGPIANAFAYTTFVNGNFTACALTSMRISFVCIIIRI
jgi:hypothetical protein